MLVCLGTAGLGGIRRRPVSRFFLLRGVDNKFFGFVSIGIENFPNHANRVYKLLGLKPFGVLDRPALLTVTILILEIPPGLTLFAYIDFEGGFHGDSPYSTLNLAFSGRDEAGLCPRDGGLSPVQVQTQNFDRQHPA